MRQYWRFSCALTHGGGAAVTARSSLPAASVSRQIATSEKNTAHLDNRPTSKMSWIRDLNLTYEVLNKENTFSDGDTVAGTVTFILMQETKIERAFVKVKGDANVHWMEGTGDHSQFHFSHRRYFEVKEDFVARNEGTKLSEGVHCFKFRLQIPHGDMPSSFRGGCGEIVCMLEAEITKLRQMPSRDRKELKFVSKSLPHHGQVMGPQSGSVDKEIGVFYKGQVHMSATVDRKVFSPGDTLSVVAKIRNSSTKKMKPKFSLRQKIAYFTYTNRHIIDLNLGKMVGDTIAPNSEETVSCQLKIPDDVIYTLHNCEIISVAYYLKVYLDISFAFDPEVVFPLIIVPASSAAVHPAGAVGAPSYSDFPPPADPAPTAPGAYGYPAPDPTQQTNTASGYDNQWPQQAPPDKYRTAAFPPSPVQLQAPTAPPGFQQGEEPPACVSLFPTPQDAVGSTGSDYKN